MLTQFQIKEVKNAAFAKNSEACLNERERDLVGDLYRRGYLDSVDKLSQPQVNFLESIHKKVKGRSIN